MIDHDGGLPLYILDDDTILCSSKNINHIDYWENTVSKIVAEKYQINRVKILNLPYSQRRARIVGNIFYCGEKITKDLLRKIEKKLKIKLKFVYDEHETRCSYELAEFKGLKS